MEPHDFDVELKVLWQYMEKQVQIMDQFDISFMLSFEQNKAYNMWAIMLNLCFKGSGLFIQYVQKGNKLHIVSVYDRHISLLLFLVHANPNGVTKKVMICTLNGSKGHMITIYDFMKTNEQNAWLVIKNR